MRHIHLHPLGGVSGDMFVGCLLDAFPEHRAALIETAATLAQVDCRWAPHDDGTLTGSRFVVDEAGHGPGLHHDRPHHDTHHHDHHHSHTSWRDIRARLEASGLAPSVRAHAIGIFGVLAEAEGRVHGMPADAVAFHKVGAADSIADIVAAAVVIEASVSRRRCSPWCTRRSGWSRPNYRPGQCAAGCARRAW